MRLVMAMMAAATLTGCGLDGGSDVDVELGAIVFYEDGPEIDVPGTARAGDPIVIGVVTAGGGCVDHVRTDVEHTGDHVAIYPLDTRPPPDALCTLELRWLQHTATFSFATPGTKTVEIVGRSVDARGDETISLPFSIDVTP